MTRFLPAPGIDRSLAAIASESEQLLAARSQLVGGPPAGPTASPSRARASRSSTRRAGRGRRGETMKRVLSALDPTEPRTAGDVGKLAKVDRPLAGRTLSWLVKQGLATKAERGYLRAAS